ncbi:hypothetical protein Ddye_004374 [Dipteronia dyeriana]|uniref:Reverse transcriptase domain-containing protein n=1 Tax=Dipteronia dyeriana TaxID=168575 RepID=A0AAE0CW89_9ROSI|nr:hypothetical protein Ddye_004374 [Dipteronia dyeriana]
MNFFKANWGAIQEDFMNFINEFHRDGSVVRELNRAFIALIPKVGNPLSMKDFRPISLVSSMYKVLAKVLTNRLRKVMNSIIGEAQMAFIENRQSSDSLVIAEEIIHKWRSGNDGGFLVKLEFEKAYNNVDHDFLDSMLEGMGFDVESIDQQFLNYSWSSVLWRMCMDWWRVQCCLNSSVKKWLEKWSGQCPAFKHERAWNSLFYAIVWSIGESRNNYVFENIEPNVVKASEVVKFWVVWWFKHMGKGSTDAIQSLLINFNGDGSALGKPGPAGVGEVLRDSNGKILCLFSYHLGTMDSNKAEIWTIKIAVGSCNSTLSLRGCAISIVSDSKVAVSWVNVIYKSRAFNSFTDSLAKMEANLDGDFVEWGDV